MVSPFFFGGGLIELISSKTASKVSSQDPFGKVKTFITECSFNKLISPFEMREEHPEPFNKIAYWSHSLAFIGAWPGRIDKAYWSLDNFDNAALMHLNLE